MGISLSKSFNRLSRISREGGNSQLVSKRKYLFCLPFTILSIKA